MIKIVTSGDYVQVRYVDTISEYVQEELKSDSDAIEYSSDSNGKIYLKFGRMTFEYTDPTEFEIEGDAVTDAADFITKLTALFSSSPGGGGVGYKVYTALLSQSGTDAPTVVQILENTIGDIVWTRNVLGSYLGTLDNAFPVNKTVMPPFGGTRQASSPQLISVSGITGNTPSDFFVSLNQTGTGVIEISFYDSTFSRVEWSTILLDCPLWVEVRVYP